MDSETIKRGPGRPPKTAQPEGDTEGAEADKLFPVRLLKNYRPAGRYEIIGEMAPAPRPGLDFQHKIWAGTVVALPRDEAVRLVDNVARAPQRVVDELGKPVTRPDGSYVMRVVETRFPLAERADAFPV